MPDLPSSLTFGLVLAIALALLVYAFFILAFTSITRSRSARLRELGRTGYMGATYARLVLAHAETHLLASQTGAFISALLAGLATDALLNAPLLADLGVLVSLDSAFQRLFLALGVVGVVAFIGLSLVQIAKAIAFARPNRALCLVALPVLASTRVLWPVVWILKSTVGKLLALLGLSIPVERELAVSPEEITEIVEMSTKAGQVEEDEREMIKHVFTFSDTLTREVMTPRKDIVAVSEDASLEEVVAVFLREKISRVLVTGADLDDVRGVLIAKDLMLLVGKRDESFQVKKYIRPALFVPNSKKVDDLLAELRREAIHFAVVLDEHGGVDGVVTMEDLVEEIVGEIFDEFDSPVDEMEIQRTKSGELIVDGSTIIDDLNAQYSLGIPRGHYDTIAGFVISSLGRIPKAGEIVHWDGYTIRVEEVVQNRIISVRISLDGKGTSATSRDAKRDSTPQSPTVSSTAPTIVKPVVVDSRGGTSAPERVEQRPVARTSVAAKASAPGKG